MNILQNCPSTDTSHGIRKYLCPDAGTVLLQNIHAEIKFIIFIYYCTVQLTNHTREFRNCAYPQRTIKKTLGFIYLFV